MKTISKVLSGAMLLSGVFLASCQRTGSLSEDLTNPLDSRGGSFSIVGDLSDYQTRAHDAKWDAGDKIGVYAFMGADLFGKYANVAYATEKGDGVFNAIGEGIILRKTNKITVSAYYPFADGLKDKTYKVDVSKQEPLSDIDLLWGKAEADGAKDFVPVKFTHKLSLVELKFQAKDGKELPKSIKATIAGVTTDAELDLAQGTLKRGTVTKDLSFTAKDNTIQAILIPGEEIKSISFVFEGIDVKYDLKTPYKLEEGKKYTLTLSPYADGSLIRLRIVNEGSGITDWVAGDTLSADLPYGETETPETEDPKKPGTGEDQPKPGEDPNPGKPEPEAPSAGSLAFPGSDFENITFDDYFTTKADGSLTVSITETEGVDGKPTKAIYFKGNPKTNVFALSTKRTNAKAGQTYKTLTFWIKGTTGGRSMSINVYSSDGSKYWAFNLGNLENTTIAPAVDVASDGKNAKNSYSGVIDTKGKWMQVILDLSKVTSYNTSEAGYFFSFKTGNKTEWDLYLDNIELK